MVVFDANSQGVTFIHSFLYECERIAHRIANLERLKALGFIEVKKFAQGISGVDLTKEQHRAVSCLRFFAGQNGKASETLFPGIANLYVSARLKEFTELGEVNDVSNKINQWRRREQEGILDRIRQTNPDEVLELPIICHLTGIGPASYYPMIELTEQDNPKRLPFIFGKYPGSISVPYQSLSFCSDNAEELLHILFAPYIDKNGIPHDQKERLIGKHLEALGLFLQEPYGRHIASRLL